MKHIIKFLTRSLIMVCVSASAHQDGNKVLVTIDGKPLITEQQLNQALHLAKKAVLFYENKGEFLKEMAQQEVINKYVHDNKIDTLPAYQQELKQMVHAARTDLHLKYFFQGQVSEKELEAFYNSSSKKAAQEIVNKYISDHKIDISPAYQQELQQEINHIKSVLNSQYFTEQIASTDATLKKFHDESKERFVFFAGEFEGAPEQLNEKVSAEIERLQKEYNIVILP